MTEYDIAGMKVTISTEMENERFLEKATDGLVAGAEDMFVKWYSSKGECDSVYDDAEDIEMRILEPLAKKGVEIIKNQKVYSINEEMLIGKYLSDCFGDFYDSLDVMIDKIGEIEGNQAYMKQYRAARKKGRSRYVGYGFTMGSRMKQGMKAGALNAATGLGHSVVNSVGNVGSGISASVKKAAVYSEFKTVLKKDFVAGVRKAQSGIRKAISQETAVRFKYVTVPEADQAKAIFQNYMSGKIPEDAKRQQIVQALALNPYSRDIYQCIWDDYGDSSEDLRKMSAYFGRNLDEYINEAVEKHGKALFSKNCAAYEQAFDKKEAAINIELQIRKTLDALTDYCSANHVLEEKVSAIDKCRKLLEEVDNSLRTVEGVLYDDREIAQAVRNDYAVFYEFLKGKDIFREEMLQEVLALQFCSETVRNQVESLLEKEKALRSPKSVYSNVSTLLREMLPASAWNAGWIEVPKYIGAFEQKEGTVRTLTGMSDSEVVLAFFGRSSNGKTGIVLTNLYLRIYAKGLFSSENTAYPIEKLGQVHCLGENKYSLDILGGEPVQIDLSKRKMPAEDQIAFGKALDKLIRMIANISARNRENMFRLLNYSSVCSCGMYLIAGEKVCPSCRKILKENGEMVESEECPKCGGIIPAGKKFCSKCGNPLRATVPGTPVVETTGTRSEQSIKCPGCGNLMKAGKKFCSACGRKIEM